MNQMQRFIVEKVFYSPSKIFHFNCDWIKDQLLLYIYGKSGVRRTKIIYAIELRCVVLLRDFDLVITIPKSGAANNISGSTIYTSFAIGVKNRYKKSNTIFNF